MHCHGLWEGIVITNFSLTDVSRTLYVPDHAQQLEQNPPSQKTSCNTFITVITSLVTKISLVSYSPASNSCLCSTSRKYFVDLCDKNDDTKDLLSTLSGHELHSRPSFRSPWTKCKLDSLAGPEWDHSKAQTARSLYSINWTAQCSSLRWQR